MEHWKRKAIAHDGSDMYGKKCWSNMNVQYWKNGEKYRLTEDNDIGR